MDGNATIRVLHWMREFEVTPRELLCDVTKISDPAAADALVRRLLSECRLFQVGDYIYLYPLEVSNGTIDDRRIIAQWVVSKFFQKLDPTEAYVVEDALSQACFLCDGELYEVMIIRDGHDRKLFQLTRCSEEIHYLLVIPVDQEETMGEIMEEASRKGNGKILYSMVMYDHQEIPQIYFEEMEEGESDDA